jgi:serine/threonine-protein kinase
VAYELLTGTRPFAGGPVTAQARQHVEDAPDKATEAAPELPAAIDAVFDRGLAKDPRDRPPTAVALVTEIERALAAPTAATRRVDSTRAMSPVAPAVVQPAVAPPPAPARAPAPVADTRLRPDRAAVPADPGGYARRRATPWLPIGVAAAAVVAVVVAIALAGGGGGAANPDRTASTTAKKAPTSSSSSRKDPASSSSSGTAATTPPASPPPPPPATASTGTGTSTSGGSPSVLNDLGYRLQQAGNNTAAVPILKRSVDAFKSTGTTQDVNYHYALYNLAVSLIATGDPAAAIPYLQERLKISGDRRELVRRTLAQAQAQAGGSAAKTPKANANAG